MLANDFEHFLQIECKWPEGHSNQDGCHIGMKRPHPRGRGSRGSGRGGDLSASHISATPRDTLTATSPTLVLTMDLPSSREIELETLLRQKDAQVQELTVRAVLMTFPVLNVSRERVRAGRSHSSPTVPCKSAESVHYRSRVITTSSRVIAVAPHQGRLVRHHRVII